MNKVILLDTVRKLDEFSLGHRGRSYASDQGVAQYNGLLESAKGLFPDRVDILAMTSFMSGGKQTLIVAQDTFSDAVSRLRHALELTPINSSSQTLAEIRLPEDCPDDVREDFGELIDTVGAGLIKSSLLLSGSIAESLLITRHPDSTNKGPGLAQLVKLARDERLFGRDTLRNLDSLIEYRDLIHPRAEKRNLTLRNSARVSAAVTALKLLCSELEDLTVKYKE